jgi:aspartate-semialdehyde dehydrogenase
MAQKQYAVAVVGATGAVGETMLRLLEERNFPVRSLKLLASERSEARVLSYRGEEIKVERLTHGSFHGTEIALFSAGATRSKEFAPMAVEAGAVVIDNSSAFRMEPDVPLVVPEINAHAVAGYKARGIIANPNCTTIVMVMPLKPLHDYGQVTRVVASSYQAVSGAGKRGSRSSGDRPRPGSGASRSRWRPFPIRLRSISFPTSTSSNRTVTRGRS